MTIDAAKFTAKRLAARPWIIAPVSCDGSHRGGVAVESGGQPL
jgi:hypothetical protein